MMKDRGLKVDHSTIGRWVLAYSPEIDERTRRHLKLTNDSWRVDETYIKVNGDWKYLYRAVDSESNTLDRGMRSQASTRIQFGCLPVTLCSVREEIKKLPRDSCSVLTRSETVDSRAVRFFKKMLKARHNKQPSTARRK